MKPLTKTFNIEMFLKLTALILVSFVFLKAIIDVDRSYDTWVYHLPFAGRMWGITPVEMYEFENHEEARFAGFPILAEWFQGLFWFVFGHVQAANLVSFLSLVIYFCFLKVYFQVPLYLSAIALLAIPLVQTHATTCYVDLPGNLCIAVLILTTYLLYTQDNFTKRNLWAIFISAACAANIKPQLVPLVFVILCFTLYRILLIYFKHYNKYARLKLQVFLPVIVLASLIVFATPLKNTVVYGNPFYPVRIEIAGQVLNHTMGLYSASPDYLQEASRSQRWLYSILEINSPNWSVDQYSPDPSKTRMGGFFGAYVVFNVLLFGYLVVRTRRRETIIAAVTVIVMTVVAANFPQSHELRYFIYWMLVLVSFNLYLVTYLKRTASIIEPKYIGVVAVFALAFVITKTQAFYVKPSLMTLERYVQQTTNPKVLEQINPGEQVCLVGKQPNTFLYAAKFHPQRIFYSVKATADANNCGDRRVIL